MCIRDRGRAASPFLVLVAREDVAGATHGDDAPWPPRVVLDGRAYARDVDVDAAVERLQRVAAHALHQRVAREDPARALGEGRQQVELVAGQRPLPSVEADAARLAVDL